MYDAVVRTTFTPDPDIAAQLKALTLASNKSMNRVLNEILREALGGEPAIGERRFVVEPIPLGLRAGIDPLRLNQLVDDVEDGAMIARIARERDSA